MISPPEEIVFETEHLRGSPSGRGLEGRSEESKCSQFRRSIRLPRGSKRVEQGVKGSVRNGDPLEYVQIRTER